MNYKKAFTLIELLVVVAIIGILASVVLASLTGARFKGKNAATNQGVQEWVNALNLYYTDNGSFFVSGSGTICLGQENCVLVNGVPPAGPLPNATFVALMDPYLRGATNPMKDYVQIASTSQYKALYSNSAGSQGIQLTWFLNGDAQCAYSLVFPKRQIMSSGDTMCIYDINY
ncbi:MAG: type II secretion system protein [Patescibacteria group bacterium]